MFYEIKFKKKPPAKPIFNKNLDDNLAIFLYWPNPNCYRYSSTPPMSCNNDAPIIFVVCFFPWPLIKSTVLCSHLLPPPRRLCFRPCLSVRQGGYVFAPVCLSVCLFVCLSVCLSVSKMSQEVMEGF